jgi:hypothetical protein
MEESEHEQKRLFHSSNNVQRIRLQGRQEECLYFYYLGYSTIRLKKIDMA